tara:strand:- start:157 stop:336 length:180 start_codon:yes stop_codon:yes gene_type:complete
MVMSKHEWREDQRRFYDVMPTWWWLPGEQERHYEAYRKAALCREEKRKPEWGDPTIDME